jgi:hypothetical protein
VVEHWGDAVEPESVKAEDVDPHPEVGEEEAQDLPVVVVEQAAVPKGVAASGSRVEEAGIWRNILFSIKTKVCHKVIL